MSVFKAYDIRGEWNKDWGAETAYRIGRYLPRLLGADRVLVGRDVRLSSEEVFTALASGLVDSGCDVDDAGLATTPMVYWNTAREHFDASVQITASHNPPADNGMKISRSEALPVGGETGLKELERLCSADPGPAVEKRGVIRSFDGKSSYYEYLRSRLPNEDGFTGLKLAVDLSNGMAGLFVQDLFGIGHTWLNQELDGAFPGHEPNPLAAVNRQQLEALVAAGGFDAGVIFDGDADRVMFVDEKGNFVSPDLVTALLARPWLEQGPHPVLVDIRTSRAVEDEVSARGGKVIYGKVGHAFAKLRMRELNAPVGGELAGHYYFREFYWCDSGILAAIHVLALLEREKAAGRAFSDVLAPLRKYATSGERNFKIGKKNDAIQALRVAASKDQVPVSTLDFDGIRINFEHWWFNARVSQTEPYLRLVVEATSQDLLNEKLSVLMEVLKPFLEPGEGAQT